MARPDEPGSGKRNDGMEGPGATRKVAPGLILGLAASDPGSAGPEARTAVGPRFTATPTPPSS
jgi:hypothetical protein